MKQIRYFFEAVIVFILMRVFRIMPLDWASATGGAIVGFIGPRLGSSRKALRNIKRALPALTEAEQHEILRGMWENLGRTFAELPHIQRVCAERVELVNEAIAHRLRDDGIGAILMGGHFANWEILPVYSVDMLNLQTGAIYRAPNNAYVASVIENIRDPRGKLRAIPKSRKGARDIVRALHDHTHLILYIDQKYNQGIAADFFGHPAMTSPSFAELGQKYNVPVVPVRIERLQGARFRMTLHEPMKLADESGVALSAAQAIGNAHRLLEDWIRERPAQWLWIHRRWIEGEKE